MERYEVTENLSQIRNATTVQRAIRKGSSLSVVLKTQFHETIDRVNNVFKEMLNQQAVGHRAVCNVYECILGQDQSLLETTLVLESMKTDLHTDLRQRFGSTHHWPETKLWYFARELVDALSAAQRKGISHRDIKPENIFLTATDEVKIGDFGSSKLLLDPMLDTHSLQGSPPYFCPSLRVAYIQCLAEGRQTINLKHNLYKSDVFALGITLLTLARLRAPTDLMVLEGLTQKLETVTGEIPYSPQLKKLLGLMTAVDESLRPDFVTLQTMLADKEGPMPFGLYPPWCPSCARAQEYVSGQWACQSAVPPHIA